MWSGIANGLAPGTNKLPLVVASGRSGLRVLRPSQCRDQSALPGLRISSGTAAHLPPSRDSASTVASQQSPLTQLVLGPAVVASHSASGRHLCCSDAFSSLLALGSLRKLDMQSFTSSFSEF